MAASDCTVEYRDVPGFPGYRVGDDGSVWSCLNTSCLGGSPTDHWRQMKAPVNSKGYLYLNLARNGRARTFRVHRLILEVFVGPCPAGMECRHLNGIKTDCCLANLCWGTQEENRQDNRKLGAYQNGSAHTQAKLTEDAVRDIRKRYAAGGILQRELADEYGVKVVCISVIVRRKSWKHI